MKQPNETSALAALIPFLSEHDKAKGVEAVVDTLMEIGVMAYNGDLDRFVFRPMEVTREVFERLVERRLA